MQSHLRVVWEHTVRICFLDRDAKLLFSTETSRSETPCKISEAYFTAFLNGNCCGGFLWITSSAKVRKDRVDMGTKSVMFEVKHHFFFCVMSIVLSSMGRDTI